MHTPQSTRREISNLAAQRNGSGRVREEKTWGQLLTSPSVFSLDSLAQVKSTRGEECWLVAPKITVRSPAAFWPRSAALCGAERACLVVFSPLDGRSSSLFALWRKISFLPGCFVPSARFDFFSLSNNHATDEFTLLPEI